MIGRRLVWLRLYAFVAAAAGGLFGARMMGLSGRALRGMQVLVVFVLFALVSAWLRHNTCELFVGREYQVSGGMASTRGRGERGMHALPPSSEVQDVGPHEGGPPLSRSYGILDDSRGVRAEG